MGKRPPDDKGRGLAKLRHLTPLVRAARHAGWSVALTRNGHVKWTTPDGHSCTTSPHDRARDKLRNDLRRLGLEIDQ
jgi:hypothetical protein